MLYLDKRNNLIADEVLAEGTVDHTPVYPREVLRRAIELHATGCILVHKRAAGNPTRPQGLPYTAAYCTHSPCSLWPSLRHLTVPPHGGPRQQIQMAVVPAQSSIVSFRLVVPRHKSTTRLCSAVKEQKSAHW